jgi:6-phosphogluconolactonase
MQIQHFSEARLLTDTLVEKLCQILSDAVAERGQAYLVVSGGKTPLALFKSLAKTEIAWDKVTVTLADERCVGLNDPARNEALVREVLLQNKASKAEFLSLYDEGYSLEETEQKLASLPVFDAVILGMGEDGHTASLFPCAVELKLGLDDHAKAIIQLHPQTAAHQRISLTKPRLLKTRHMFLHLLGQQKLSVLEKAKASEDAIEMPIRAFINQSKTAVQVMYAP